MPREKGKRIRKIVPATHLLFMSGNGGENGMRKERVWTSRKRKKGRRKHIRIM